MSDPRPVRFELHILPLMRWIDRDHMLNAGSRSLDLFDYDQVRTKAEKILNRIKGDMPPESSGGPWPPEWIALFERWIREKFQRLELAKGGQFEARRSGSRIVLTITGERPSEEDKVWLDRRHGGESPREYTLYREPGSPTEPSPFEVEETFGAGATTGIVVYDAAGPHEVPIR